MREPPPPVAGAPGASLARLVSVMEALLAPDGCPWDREQTLDSLRPFLLEETYEVLDAMERGGPAAHCEELGDLMMQIVFQAAIAQGFTIDDVVAGICEKLIRRHPHVFGEVTGVDTSERVLAQWNEIKKAEKKAAAGVGSPRAQSASVDPAGATPAPADLDNGGRVLAGVPRGLPALARAQQLGDKAGKVGFDWPGHEGSLAKVREEVEELVAEIPGRDRAALHHELGDLLFATVNLARKLGLDAELALHDAGARFTQRFQYIEDRLAERGKTPDQSSLTEMDSLWDEAKAR